MNKRDYIGIASLLTGLFLAAATGYGLYYYRYDTYRNMVSNSLRIALLQELDPVEAEPVMYSTNEMNNETGSTATDTLTLSTTTSEKREEHHINANLFQHNITQDGALLGLHSYLLYKKPVVADSLYKRWKTLLSGNSVSHTDMLLRLTTKDVKTGRHTVIAPSNASQCDADSLCTWYAGGYCELEATAYACPIGYRLVTAWDYIIILLAFVACPLIGFNHRRFIFFHKVPITRATGNPTGEESEQEIHADESPKNIVYSLGENVYFDASAMTLSDKSRKQCINLQPMEASLLKCLREAEDYRMDKEALLHELWPDNAGMYSLHSSVSRLRKKLKDISQVEIKSQGRYYILIF